MFVDWKEPTTRSADGDEEVHWYLGRLAGLSRPSMAPAGRSWPSMAPAALGLLPSALGLLPGGSGYERVEVQFGHDAPGNFLINPQSGKVAFVHNGADLVVPSPDGRLLVTWNSLNPPLSVRVAALDTDGPRLVLQCETREGKARLTPVFKGWHDVAQLDLVIEIGEQSKSMARLAASVELQEGQWRVSASDIGRVAAIGLSCHSR